MQKFMKARVHITLKNGVLDPQGKAIENALGGMGFSGISEVRQGKYIEIVLADVSPERGPSIGRIDVRKVVGQHRN